MINPKDGCYFADDCTVTVLGVPGRDAYNIQKAEDEITVIAAMKVHSSTSFSPWNDVSTEFAESLGLDHTDLGRWQSCNCNPCNETVYRFVPNTNTLRLLPLLLPDDAIPPIENIPYGAVIADLEELAAAEEAVEAMGYIFEGWFWDSRMTVPLTGSDLITSDCVLYGKMTRAVTAPAAPQNVAVTPSAANELTVSYDLSPGATQYNIYRYNGAQNMYIYKGTTFAADEHPTQYVDKNMYPGTTYYYKVVAVKFTDFECNLLINGIFEWRNMLLEQGKPTEDVDVLILKIINKAEGK